ncbi:MAG: serine/threonine-protein kinase, partial [Polyangiales bacterium]
MAASVRVDDPLVGSLLAERYRVLGRIGEGGMGKVYEAQHVVLDKPVALKVLREDFSHRPEVVARFRQEARAASRIGHPHIVDVSDFGVTQAGAHFFVMELLVGHDLAVELEREGTLPTRRALQIVLQCAEALAAAHAKGIVHRDVKPENLFLVEHESGGDYVKLVDFGIAKILDAELASSTGKVAERKLTQTGVVFGTPEYMAPELALGQSADHRVDAYALGVILFELIAGRPPFLGDTFMGVLAQHAGDPIPTLAEVNPSCFAPPALEALVVRALAKKPDDRHPSMAAFAEEVARLLETLTADPPRAALPGTITHAPRVIEPS